MHINALPPPRFAIAFYPQRGAGMAAGYARYQAAAT